MVTERYKDYMRSRKWAQFRQRALAHYGKKCFACGTFRGPIQIHHLTYIRFGREQLRDVRPLCQACHREVTRLHWKMGKRKVNGEIVFATFMKMKRQGTRPQKRKK